MRRPGFAALLIALPLTGACAPVVEPAAPATDPTVEATSLLGEPLARPLLAAERLQRLEADLAAAQAAYEADPGDESAIIWVGRRNAYLGRYGEAIETYTRGIEVHPDSYRLFRHRGHRYITLRRFDDAVADLTRAAELAEPFADAVEPDGIPNALNTPLSTDKFNIWYHLALAHYLRGDYGAALAAYERCLEVSTNPDLLVATSDWMYMTLRRLGRHADADALLAPITAELEIVENDAYHQRLLMYKGEVEPDALLDLRAVDDPDAALQIATQGYGVGNWYLAEGNETRAYEVFEAILGGTSWAAFGYIAAEADVARRGAVE